MSLHKGLLVVGVGSLVLLTRLVVAGETGPAGTANAPAAKKAAPAAAGESVEHLIGQLDSPNFDEREAACGKLAAKGKEAVAALEKAAANGNLEVSSRATTILGKFLKSSDEPTEKAANEALQRLADGDSPAAARKAQSILDKKDSLKNNAPGLNGTGGIVLPGGGFGGQIIINGGQLNIGGGAGMRTMTVRNVNGVKEITATEDGKTVKIHDDPGKAIKVELTEKVNGKEVTKTYEAKDAKELKKNHPAGYELYKKYGGEQPGNGIQFQLQGNLQAVPRFPMPFQPPLPGQPPLPLQPPALLPPPGSPLPRRPG